MDHPGEFGRIVDFDTKIFTSVFVRIFSHPNEKLGLVARMMLKTFIFSLFFSPRRIRNEPSPPLAPTGSAVPALSESPESAKSQMVAPETGFPAWRTVPAMTAVSSPRAVRAAPENTMTSASTRM
jgi:hypothetical protein